MMCHWRDKLFRSIIILILFNLINAQSNSRSYDTNDWIPVVRPSTQNEESQQEISEKRPTGRVLNLPAQDNKKYFVGQTNVNFQHKIQEREKQQSINNYVPNLQHQILLPPQLQRIVSQSDSYLSPQRINTQLQQQNYQGMEQFFSNQDYPQNSTNFEIGNSGLFNTQPLQQPIHHSQTIKQDHPEVQLLYVPLENLQQKEERQQLVFPSEQINSFQQYLQQHKQAQLHNIEQDFVQQTLQAQKLQEQLQHNIHPTVQQTYRNPVSQPLTQSTTASTVKKRKPHQPPLAVYMGKEGKDIKIEDVLTLLKDAKTITVQDTVGPNTPQVFVGPSHLEPPEGYKKFDLPYLSSLNDNRIERKVEQLPFFVAPLSYKAPPGYSKIPFPAPHVGSVVVNQLKTTPQPQSTSTESFGTVRSQILPETSSQIPEIVTVRTTRGRQRQSNRNYYLTSTENVISKNIPYGPVPTRIPFEVQQQYSTINSFTSQNPYGPVSFIQSTTPTVQNKPVTFPEQIFSTKNRFLTTTAYNLRNPTKYNYINQRPETTSTEHTSTLSENLLNDKYTVLEQFPINGKQEVPLSQENLNQQIPEREQFQPQNYNSFSEKETALPLITNSPYTNNYQYDVKNYFNQQQAFPEPSPTKQTYFDYQGSTQQYKPTKTQNDETKTKHYNPTVYFQEEYTQQNFNTKPSETLKPVTKEFEISTQSQDKFLSNVYYQNGPQSDLPQNIEYRLPEKLPPISPQLPGLINSLQDQQIRPLLAPLLIPASDQPPLNKQQSHTEDYYSSSEEEVVTTQTSTTTLSSTTSTTQSPIDETTTQFSRTRSSQRGTRPTNFYDYVTTTSKPRRTTVYRGRRPSNSEANKNYEVYSLSTTDNPTVDYNTFSKTTTSRRRYTDQKLQISTTEQPRKSQAQRQRFRTRGRPVKNENDHNDESTVETSGFQVSVPLSQLDDQESNIQKEQALVYVENKSNPVTQLYTQDQLKQEDYKSGENQKISSEPLEPIQLSSIIATTGPANNFVSELIHDKPVSITNQQFLKYSNPTESLLNTQTDYSTKQKESYGESEVKDEASTEHVSLQHIRSKTRTRVNPQSSRQQLTSTSTIKSTSNSEQESEEFYGFFRQPSFAKPAHADQISNSELLSNSKPNTGAIYLRRPVEEKQRNQYINHFSTSPSPYFTIKDNYGNHNNPSQYVSSTISSPVLSENESTVHITQATRQPVSNNSYRIRRPVANSNRYLDQSTENSSETTEKYYVRPSKRPVVQTTNSTRIRGRIRRPTRYTTAKPTEDVNSNSPQTNEFEKNRSSEQSTVRTQTFINRGKSHFQLPNNEKSNEEIEEENYPKSFLQRHTVPKKTSLDSNHYNSHLSSTASSVDFLNQKEITPKPVFQLTIEPESDEVDFEDGVEESKYSAKFIEKPQNFNYIPSYFKNLTKDEDKFDQITENLNNSEPKNTEDTSTQSINRDTNENYTSLLTTDSTSTSTIELSTEKSKSHRRGVWRLVKTRPVGEEFESAESQNIQSSFNENHISSEKPIRKYSLVQRIRTTTEQNEAETATTIPNEIEITTKLEQTSTSEKSLFASLYEMFSSNSNEQNTETINTVGFTTTEIATELNTDFKPLDSDTTEMNSSEMSTSTVDTNEKFHDILSKDDISRPQKIIGTSTTTEISHETEICYRGRCVKSTEDNKRKLLV